MLKCDLENISKFASLERFYVYKYVLKQTPKH